MVIVNLISHLNEVEAPSPLVAVGHYCLDFDLMLSTSHWLAAVTVFILVTQLCVVASSFRIPSESSKNDRPIIGNTRRGLTSTR